MKTKAFVCDIDGVILTLSKWYTIEEFYENIMYCYPIDWAVHLVKGLQKGGIKPLFLTARDSRYKGITEHQLKQCFDFPIHLDMRLHGDLREDFEIKRDYIEQYLKEYEILFCIDDNKKNCEMYKTFGLTSLWVDSKRAK